MLYLWCLGWVSSRKVLSMSIPQPPNTQNNVELRQEIAKHFDVTHDDSDSSTCPAQYEKCSTCGKQRFSHINWWPCKHPCEQFVEQDCNCGAQKEADEHIDQIMKLFAAHLQATAREARIDELDRLLAPLTSVMTQSVDELTIVKRMRDLKQGGKTNG